jgi:hypothetical protein
MLDLANPLLASFSRADQFGRLPHQFHDQLKKCLHSYIDFHSIEVVELVPQRR